MKKYDVVAIGELLVDFTSGSVTAQGNSLFEANPGGAPCNVLAMLARLGKKTAFIGKVGGDMFGTMLVEAANDAQIDTSGLIVDPSAATTLAFVQTDILGERSFSFFRNPGADTMLTIDELRRDIIKDCEIFHFGSLSLTHQPARDATREAVRLADECDALISFDPNIRPALWSDMDTAREQIEWGLSVCDILKVSEDELKFVTNCDDIEQCAASLLRKHSNINICFVTKGAKGAEAYTCTNELRVYVPALSVTAIDTTGAGDTFYACCLASILDNGIDSFIEGDPNDVSVNLGHTLQFACAAAAIVATRKGAIRAMPTVEEINAALKKSAVMPDYASMLGDDAMSTELCLFRDVIIDVLERTDEAKQEYDKDPNNLVTFGELLAYCMCIFYMKQSLNDGGNDRRRIPLLNLLDFDTDQRYLGAIVPKHPWSLQ